MKKVFFAAVAVLALASCKKDWTCECAFSNSPNLNIPIKDQTKKDAKSVCDTYNSTYSYASGSCSLK